MSRHDPIISLRHMQDHAKEAIAMTAEMSESGFRSDRQLSLALMRLVEIVGEAAGEFQPELETRIPPSPSERFPA